jgi:hypothetical protein
MKVLAFDIGKTFVGITAEDPARPRYLDLRAFEYPTAPRTRYTPDLADEWAADCLERIGHDGEFLWGVSLVVWERPWMHPTKDRARVNPDSIAGLHRMTNRCVEFAVSHGMAWREVDVQAMTAATTFRKLTRDNAETCIRMAPALLDGFPFGVCDVEGGRRAWFGYSGGLGIAEHVWDAARIARYALTGANIPLGTPSGQELNG